MHISACVKVSYSVGNRCQSQRTNVSRIEKETAGNSRGIRRVFRGNSDGKKGIPISRIKNIPRFAVVFYAEATPSSPFIILKGGNRSKMPSEAPQHSMV